MEGSRAQQLIVPAGVAVAVAAPTARWWAAVDPPSWPLAVASLVGVALFVAVCVAVLARVLGTTSRPVPTATAVVAGCSLALTAVSWVAPEASEAPPLALLAAGAAVAAGALLLLRHHRGLWDAWTTGAPATVLFVGGVALLVGVPPLDEMVWTTADQTTLANMTRMLLEFDLVPFYYMVGTPLTLAPAAFAVEAWEIPERLLLANVLNPLVLPLNVGVAMPVALGLCARATGVASTRARTLAALAVGGAMLAYSVLPPGFTPARNVELLPLRLTGLVFGPEIVGLLFLAVALVVLADTSRPWDPVLVGVLTGLAVISVERYLLLVAPFVVLVATVPARRGLLARTVAVAAAVCVPQVVYFRLRYGGWIFPNRRRVWDGGRADYGADFYASRYDFPIEGRPIDPAYVGTNLPQIVGAHWWLILLLGTGVAAAWWMEPRRWRLWTFCLVVALALVAVSSAFINVVVSWRYDVFLVPLAAVPALAAARLARSDQLGRRSAVRRREARTG